jgi:hypothetical protein
MPLRRWAYVLLLTLVPILSFTQGQSIGPFNERDVKRQANVQDVSLGDKIWVIDFRFKAPRLITVDIPGKGKKVVWYMWYQVVNNTGEPRYFIPEFELVTLDKHTSHKDQIIPKAEQSIKRVEDPTGYMDIKNSVIIASQPIPPTKANSAPRAVTGVAIWDDVFAEEPDTKRFSIYVSGLSNGYSEVDGPGGKKLLRRKTLQLNFKRLSDRFHLDAEVKFVSPEEWIYRASTLPAPEVGGDEGKPLEKEKGADK